MTNHPYYSYDKLFSFNGTFNFLTDSRGTGKTYGAKKKAIRDFFKRGDQFIYLRRYKPELIAAKNTFFADITDQFPDWDFRVVGPLAQTSPEKDRSNKEREWFTIGFFVALSSAQSQKSVAFPKVKTIIFDEFIIEKGNIRYLTDETTIFNNFYATVDRWKDKTKVLFLANSVSMMNPYFIKYGIRPDEGEEFVIKANGFIVCHFPNSKDFRDSVYETSFGKFIKDSDYADYAVGNEFSDAGINMVGIKDSKAKYVFTLECNNGTFSVWHNIYTRNYYMQEKRPKSETIFTLIPERMDIDRVLMTFTDKPLQYLRTAFRQARVFFDSPSTRNSFTEIFKK